MPLSRLQQRYYWLRFEIAWYSDAAAPMRGHDDEELHDAFHYCWLFEPRQYWGEPPLMLIFHTCRCRRQYLYAIDAPLPEILMPPPTLRFIRWLFSPHAYWSLVFTAYGYYQRSFIPLPPFRSSTLRHDTTYWTLEVYYFYHRRQEP